MDCGDKDRRPPVLSSFFFYTVLKPQDSKICARNLRLRIVQNMYINYTLSPFLRRPRNVLMPSVISFRAFDIPYLTTGDIEILIYLRKCRFHVLVVTMWF